MLLYKDSCLPVNWATSLFQVCWWHWVPCSNAADCRTMLTEYCVCMKWGKQICATTTVYPQYNYMHKCTGQQLVGIINLMICNAFFHQCGIYITRRNFIWYRHLLKKPNTLKMCQKYSIPIKKVKVLLLLPLKNINLHSSPQSEIVTLCIKNSIFTNNVQWYTVCEICQQPFSFHVLFLLIE